MFNKRYITAAESQELIYNYCQGIFKGKLEILKNAKMNFSVREEAKRAIIELSEDIEKPIEHFPPNVQKYIYEVMLHALTLLLSLSIDEPQKPLPAMIDDSMSDNEKLSLLLKTGILQMVDFFEKSHQ